MHGHTVDRGRIDHHREGSCEGSGLEGLEVFLADHLRIEIGGGTVLACPGSTVCKVVLGARTYMEAVYVVVVLSLITLDLCHHHLCIEDGILAEALIDTGPAGIAAQVYDGVIHPRTVGCTTLVSRNLCTTEGQIGIEGGAEVDGLREEGTALSVGDTVVVVETIDIGDTQILHRLLLNQTDPLLPLIHLRGTGAGGIQDRTYLPL